MAERRFPIQNVGTIPWSLAERAYENYARRYGRSRSMERLAERGGFGLQEFAYFYFNNHKGPNPGHHGGDDREWSHVCRDLVRLIREHGHDFKLSDEESDDAT